MDFNASLRRAIKTGNVILGQNNTEKCIKEGKAQMVVVAGNCPSAFTSKLTAYENLFIHTFEGVQQLLSHKTQVIRFNVFLLTSFGERCEFTSSRS